MGPRGWSSIHFRVDIVDPSWETRPQSCAIMWGWIGNVGDDFGMVTF